MKTRTITLTAVIAALYAAITVGFALIPGLNSLMFGSVQFRLAEALTVLPYFTPVGIWGLTIGCFVSNLFSPYPIDMLVGTLASFMAAVLTYLIGRKKNRYSDYIAPLPAVIINAFLVGAQISIISKTPFFYNAMTVAVGQFAVCYLLGLPIIKMIKKRPYLADCL